LRPSQWRVKEPGNSLQWYVRPTFSMLSGEPRLYNRYADGLVIEAGHFLLRKRSLMRRFRGRIFALDPRTPAFQCKAAMAVDPRTEKIRTSYLRLAARHGGPIWHRFSRLEPVKPEDMSRSSCETIALGMVDLQKAARASVLLSPYFVVEGPQDPWVQVNRWMFEATSGAEDGTAYMPIAFRSSLLADRKSLDQVCGPYLELGAPGYAVWPAGLNEMSASAEELDGLAHVLGMFPERSFVLYGGYFTMLLCALNRQSFSSGPCFYERRDIKIAPPLEFRPRCRYYLPPLYEKVDPVSAVVFYRLISDMGIDPRLCPACLRNLGDGGFDGIAAMPDLDIFEHNLMTRRDEIEVLKACPDPALKAEEGFRWLVSHRSSFPHFRSLRYVKTWIKVLERIRS